MAYNKTIIAGTVITAPEFNMDSVNGDVLHVRLRINRKDIGKSEEVTVSLYDSDLIQRGVQTIEINDYFVTSNAKIMTTTYTKTVQIICSSCGEADYAQAKAEKTEIQVIDFELIKNVNPETAVGINKVFVMGNVCSALNFRPANGSYKDYIKYKLAVNRIGIAKEIQSADYPFIVSFGKEAESSNLRLKPSSEVFIEGSIQERPIIQKVSFTCDSCKKESLEKSKSYVREIITSKVEYLNKSKS